LIKSNGTIILVCAKTAMNISKFCKIRRWSIELRSIATIFLADDALEKNCFSSAKRE